MVIILLQIMNLCAANYITRRYDKHFYYMYNTASGFQMHIYILFHIIAITIPDYKFNSESNKIRFPGLGLADTKRILI